MPQMQDEAGNIWEVDAQGNPIALVSQAATEAPPQDPAFQYEGRKASAQTTREEIGVRGDTTDIADTESTIKDREADNRRADSRVSSQNATDAVSRRTAGLPAGYKWSANGEEVVKIPGYEFTDDESGKLNDKAVAAKRLLEMLDGENGIAAQFDENFANQGFASINEFNPFREANERFDKKTNSMLPFAKKLLRSSGEGGQSDSEGKDYRDQLPRSNFRDGTNAQLIEDLRATALSVLENEGVSPDSYDQETGTFFDVPSPNMGLQAKDESPNAIQSASAPQLGQATGERYSTPKDIAFAKLIQDKLNGGASLRQMVAASKKFGHSPDLAQTRSWARAIDYRDGTGEYKGNGPGMKRTLPPEQSGRRSAAGQVISDFANTTPGAIAINVANMGGFGVPEMLTGDAISDLNEQNPGAAMLGQIGGGITGAGLISKAGGAVARKIAPSLLGGGTKAQVARNVATDAAYGGAYGSTAGDGALEGAAFGTVGSLGGQAIGKGLSSAIRGVKVSPAAQALKDKGVSVSVARQLGHITSRGEDLLQSIPFVGGQVRARQADSFADFNRAAFQEAGVPTGVQPTAIGREGLDELKQGVSARYSDAVSGDAAPLDRQFLRDLVPVKKMGEQLSDTNARQLGDTLKDAVQVPANAGQITGQQFQDAMSALKATRSNARGVMPNSAQTLRNASTATMDALEGAVRRSGGQDSIDALSAANAGNRNMKILENASLDKAKIGTQTGEAGVFTPAQLLGSARQTERKFGDTVGLRELAEQGQQVLPSTVPNSGTADRAMAAAALGGVGLGGFGFGETQLTGDASNTMTAGGLAGALALLGTRRGQKAVEAALINRPQAMQRLGDGLGRRTGLFGAGGAGVALNAQ